MKTIKHNTPRSLRRAQRRRGEITARQQRIGMKWYRKVHCGGVTRVQSFDGMPDRWYREIAARELPRGR